MRRMGGVAQQDDVLVVPALTQDAGEGQPGRTAQVLGVAHQRPAVEIIGEQLLAFAAGLVLVHVPKAELVPGLGRTFDDKGARALVELIGVGPDPAVLGLQEGEGEGIEGLVDAEPDELVASAIHIDPEMVGVGLADLRVGAVGGDDQVGTLEALERIGDLDLVVEVQADPEIFSPALEDIQQLLAADTDKAVAARRDDLALDMHVDIVPVGVFGGHQAGALGIAGLQVAHGLVGQHHPPAEGVVGAVALVYVDLMVRIAQLHRNGEVKPRRAGSDDRYFHRFSGDNVHRLCGHNLHRHCPSLPAQERYFKLKIIAMSRTGRRYRGYNGRACGWADQIWLRPPNPLASGRACG